MRNELLDKKEVIIYFVSRRNVDGDVCHDKDFRSIRIFERK